MLDLDGDGRFIKEVNSAAAAAVKRRRRRHSCSGNTMQWRERDWGGAEGCLSQKHKPFFVVLNPALFHYPFLPHSHSQDSLLHHHAAASPAPVVAPLLLPLSPSSADAKMLPPLIVLALERGVGLLRAAGAAAAVLQSRGAMGGGEGGGLTLTLYLRR